MDKNQKNRILDSWIMVEHLSEGDIKPDGKDMYKFDKLTNGDFLSLFSLETEKLMEKKFINKNNAYGYMIYFDIFDFSLVVEFLRKLYKLDATSAELSNSKKFTFSICFDKKFQLIDDSLFYTESAYILSKKAVPYKDEFDQYEENLKTKIAKIFNDAECDISLFNSKMKELVDEFGFSLENSRFKIVKNVETDCTNLHSFFVSDLELAKNTDAKILNLYLEGCKGKRVNLDSRNNSPAFNPEIFGKILMPENYPLGRFPSNTKYALSFMQQVAVNLAIGLDGQSIISVNGPPGTGKTTLLKDVFSELVVRQAETIIRMKDKKISGTKETVYFGNASIGEVPSEISENGIVVASSNNSAVKNIVDELPLVSGVDEELAEEIKSADYFFELANSDLQTKWVNDENGKPHEELLSEPCQNEARFWGIFSLEGGRKDNINKILTDMKHIYKFLEEDYVSDTEIYDIFKKQLDDVKNYRSRLQKAAEKNERLTQLSGAVGQYCMKYKYDSVEKYDSKNRRITELYEKIDVYKKELKAKQIEFDSIMEKTGNSENYKAKLIETKKFLEENKPGLFDFKRKTEYKNNCSNINEMIYEEDMKLLKLNKEEVFVKSKISEISGEIAKIEKIILDTERKYNEWREAEELRIKNLKDEIALYKQQVGENVLDMNIDYASLQLSNPWFDRKYRCMQSKLFIAALRVRKQFLFENRKNIKAAVTIWQHRKNYEDKNRVVIAAWHWINFTIPVISSTFASFSNMCRDLPPETLGHLFIDEAGQAIPQASVGAVLRSRHVTVVGDPAQIKPVLTLDPKILRMLCEHFKISEKYLSDSSSTQTLADLASVYGFYRSDEQTEENRIGVPLWVHRRCKEPMFSISNELSYNGLMVPGETDPNKNLGKTAWFNISGKASDKYVEEQGEFLLNMLSEMIKKDPSIIDKKQKDKVYIITPFANVAMRLGNKLKSIGFTRYDGGKLSNIGTIHTFQGKEAPVVFMVLGADKQSRGAAMWAVDEPNMMNVAATRAKEEFYVIGDRELYSSLGSETINITGKVIREYSKKYPELCPEMNRKIPEKNDRVEDSAAVSKVKSVVRTVGTVSFVGRGKTSFYAYVNGNDGKKYTITEKVYSATQNAESIIKNKCKISFVADKQGKYIFDIKSV